MTAMTYFATLFSALLVADMLGYVYAVIFAILLFPIKFCFIGKLLERTKRTLRSQEIFVSNVAHELRGSMSVMMLDSERALLSVDSNNLSGMSQVKSQELINALKTDLSGLKKMANIIHNLSSIASYEYKSGHLELTRIDLRPLLERICDAAHKGIAGNKNVTIQRTGVTPAYINGNESAILQMLENLMSNAVKYSSDGGLVAASVFTTTNEVTVVIKDNGIGISKKDMACIFDPFYRSDDWNARKEEGSGLGLAIVSEVVREHKAKIIVKSILSEGTEVSINFPAFA